MEKSGRQLTLLLLVEPRRSLGRVGQQEVGSDAEPKSYYSFDLKQRESVSDAGSSQGVAHDENHPPSVVFADVGDLENATGQEASERSG